MRAQRVRALLCEMQGLIELGEVLCDCACRLEGIHEHRSEVVPRIEGFLHVQLTTQSADEAA